MNTSSFGRRLQIGLAAVSAFTLFGGAALVVAPAAYAQAASSNNVTLNLQNAPIQTVLRNLFKNAGKNFTIDPNVTGFVTVDVNQVPFDTALQAVLSGANPPLTAPTPTDANGIYHVQIAQPVAVAQTPPSTNNNGGANGDVPSTTNDPHHFYRIPLNRYDAYYMSELIAQFNRKGGPPTEVPSDPTGAQYGYSGLGTSGGGGGGGGGFGGGGGGFGGGGGNRGGGGFGGGGGGFGGGGGGFGGGGNRGGGGFGGF